MTPGLALERRNGVATQIGDDRFAFFATSFSKSRRNFLEILRAGNEDYILKRTGCGGLPGFQRACEEGIFGRLRQLGTRAGKRG